MKTTVTKKTQVIVAQKECYMKNMLNCSKPGIWNFEHMLKVIYAFCHQIETRMKNYQ